MVEEKNFQDYQNQWWIEREIECRMRNSKDQSEFDKYKREYERIKRGNLSQDQKLDKILTQQEEILALLKEKKRKGYVVPGLVGRNAYR